jgi:ubiquinone/menaquinone biosynthesis C-methylase UbiE
LDLSPKQIERAERLAPPLGGRVRFVIGSALDLPFPDATFDALVSIASIKHWPDQAKGVAECVRVLKPGGPFAIFEADRGCRLEDARRFVDRWRLPPMLRPFALQAFRTYVAGQSIDLEDARKLLEAQPIVEATAERVPGAPVLLLTGRRPA